MAVDLESLSNYDVINLWAASKVELQRREIVRTSNVVGDLAEAIGHEHLGGVRGHFSKTGWDVHTPDGEYVQIKGLWKTSPQRTKLSAIRGSEYDWLLAIVFGPTFDLLGAYRANRGFVERNYRVIERVNGRQPTVTRKFINDPEVETLELSAVYRRIISTSSPIDRL